MGKVSKRLLIVLLIGAFVIPMFVGCEKETPAPPTDYKAEFLGELKTEVGKSNVATLTTSGDDLTVTFTNSDFSTVYTAATDLVTTFKTKIGATSELLLGEVTFKFDNSLELVAVKNQILVLTSGEYNDTFAYKANIKGYKGHDFTLDGEVTIKGVEVDP
jgi:hypothetical protein